MFDSCIWNCSKSLMTKLTLVILKQHKLSGNVFPVWMGVIKMTFNSSNDTRLSLKTKHVSEIRIKIKKR